MKITLTAAQAATLGKAITPAISTDKTRLSLTMVHVTTTDDTATFTATDGYRMHRITVPYSSDGTYNPLNLDGDELVTALGNAAKAIGKRSGDVTIEYNPNGPVEITGGGLSQHVAEYNLDFPTCDSVIGVEPETEPDAYFHGPYMAELITAASTVAGKVKKGHHDAGLVQIVNIHPRKPMHVRSVSIDNGMTFHGILMPRRAK